MKRPAGPDQLLAVRPTVNPSRESNLPERAKALFSWRKRVAKPLGVGIPQPGEDVGVTGREEKPALSLAVFLIFEARCSKGWANLSNVNSWTREIEVIPRLAVPLWPDERALARSVKSCRTWKAKGGAAKVSSSASPFGPGGPKPPSSRVIFIPPVTLSYGPRGREEDGDPSLGLP